MNFNYSPPALQPVGQHHYHQPVRQQHFGGHNQQAPQHHTLHHQQHQNSQPQPQPQPHQQPPPPPQVWQQQQSNQQYNMNSSEYSSSTYHIYDQISDLIIIKQQRMERKRQQEQKRRMILFTLITILLVGTLVFLLLQALFASQASSNSLQSANNLQKQFSPDFALQDLNPNVRSSFGGELSLSGGLQRPTIDAPYPMWATGNVWPPIMAPPMGSPSRLPAQNQQPTIFQQTQNTLLNLHPPSQVKPKPPTQKPLPPLVQLQPLPPVTTQTPQVRIIKPQTPPPQPQAVERQCDDGIDNDKDGLIDCADSECCSDKYCQNSTLCITSPDPLDILMRKQPPPPTSSFFQRMQFLIEKFSSQIYSHPKDFNDSLVTSKHVDRASVIRGRVTYMKQAVTGVRVSVVGQFSLGVTLTREGGYFDLMVNGGGAVTIEFRREPFATHQKSVRVPWNEIVLMEPVELSLENSPIPVELSSSRPPSPLPEPDVPTCTAHNYRLMRPVIVSGPKSSRRSQQQQSKAVGSRAVILQESGLVQLSIPLPASAAASNPSQQEFPANWSNESVSLVYISNRANEFMSTINIQLVPSTLDNSKLLEELRVIHLKIVIEGNLFEQMFEPQANLTYTYAWNRRNVYKQKSYGLSTASVSVGYEYQDCKHVIWTTKQIKLPGHDLSISDVGQQWNLNIHHRYNYRDAILQRGDGQNFNLKTDRSLVVQPIIGDGLQRQTLCGPYCDTATTPADQRLLKPQALVSAPDGSLYVGDFNLIRKVEFAPPTGASGSASSSSAAASHLATQLAQSAGSSSPGANKQQVLGLEGSRKSLVRTILELPSARVPSKYSLALSLADNKLFMTDVDRYQIYEVREQSSSSHPSQPNETAGAMSDESLLPVVGSGLKCQLEDRANCGDGQPAKSARLVEPKAIAFDLSNRMYIADGPNVRMVDTDSKIYTILGNYAAVRHTKFPCSGEAIPMHKFVPKNPLDLALSPVDDTLHILDDNVVYKVTQDKRVQIVAGRLSHCLQGPQPEGRRLGPTEIFLQSAQSITFNQNGDLFVGEEDQRLGISRVLLVSPEEDSVSLYAGLPVEKGAQQLALPSVDANHFLELALDQEALGEKQRSSNLLAVSQSVRASEYKFGSIAATAVDQQGRLIVADSLQLRLVSVEADLPRTNEAGEYELISPDNADELLVFNRFGHHVATRDAAAAPNQRQPNNKYTFQYNVNTSFGQLASVSYQTGNKISIYRDGPHHSVKMIETVFGGQCKLDVGRNGQVHSITTIAPDASKTNFSYHVDGGLLKQSRDQASGELFDFQYDEFGRATEIVHSSPKSALPVECRFNPVQKVAYSFLPGADCSSLIVSE